MCGRGDNEKRARARFADNAILLSILGRAVKRAEGASRNADVSFFLMREKPWEKCDGRKMLRLRFIFLYIVRVLVLE